MASTNEELARLDAEGVPSGQRIWTWYFFSHFGSTHAERRAFREAMEAAGFTNLGSDTEASDDQYWHHWSHTIRPADRGMLREADRVAASISSLHGVRYDEWQVARDDRTAQLRPVDS
jgi:hypothetical protein